MAICPNDVNLKRSFDRLLLVSKAPRKNNLVQLQKYKAARLDFINELKLFMNNNPAFNAGPFLRVTFFLVRHGCYHPHVSRLTHKQISEFVYCALPGQVKKLARIVTATKLNYAFSHMMTISSKPPYTYQDYDLLEILCY